MFHYSNLLSILVIAGYLAFNGLQAIANIILVFAINDVIKKDVAGFISLLLLAALCYILVSVINYLTNVSKQKVIQQCNHQIRKKVILNSVNNEAIVKYTVNVNKKVNALTNDLVLLDQNYLDGFFGIFNSFFGLIFATIVLGTFHWSLLIISVFLSILVLLIPQLFRKQLSSATRDISAKNKVFIEVLSDWLSGIYDLTWNGALGILWKRIAPSAKNLETSYVENTKVVQVTNQLSALLDLLSQILINAAAGVLAIWKLVSIGVVFSAGNSAYQLFGSVQIATKSLIKLQSGKSIAANLIRMTNLNIVAPSKAKVVSKINFKILKLKNLTYNFSNSETISYPTVSIKKGDKVLIVGKSGSGKSTLINILSGRYRNYGGSVTLNDIEISDISFAALHQLIGIQPQKYHLFSTSILNNIALFSSGFSEEEISGTIKQAQLNETVHKFKAGVNTTLNDLKDNLSGGEQQRISLARSLLRKKQILIVDEGISSLDRINAEKITHVLVSDPTLTVLFITHTVDNNIKRMFNRVISL